MNDVLEKFNKSSIALKNVILFFGIVVAVVLFWANTNSHVHDKEVHLTPQARAKLIILLDDFEELVIRVEKKDKRANEKIKELKARIKSAEECLYNNK